MDIELPIYPRGNGFVSPKSVVTITPFSGPGGIIIASVNLIGGERLVINASIEDTCRALRLKFARCRAYGSDVEILVQIGAVSAIADHPQNPCAILYFTGGRIINVIGSAEQIRAVFRSPESEVS